MTVVKLKKDLLGYADPKQAAILQRFFKTGKGEYGEGDIFIGIKVPMQRKVAKNYDLSLNEIEELLHSKIHEHRLTSLFLLVDLYKKFDKKEVFDLYLKNTKYINNWDLVDLSAPSIIGDYLIDKKKDILFELAKSESIWERRIAILASYTFIKNNRFDETMKISEILLNDEHDLIHKAVGWMLREVGKRDQSVEEKFLKKYHKKMPRTMLRYAIEKFDKEKRKLYMQK